MRTTLTTALSTACSLVITMNSSQGGNAFPSDPPQAAAPAGTQGSPCRSAPKIQVAANGRHVALSTDGKLRCSTDGIEWSVVDLPNVGFLRGVAFGNGQFVAVGGSYIGGGSVVLTSANGRSWDVAARPSKHVLHSVAHFGNRFIAVGAGGTILVSKSGRRWQRQTSGTEATLASIAWGNGVCVVGGDDGLILTSRDAVFWTRQRLGTSRYIGKITFEHERFVAMAGATQLASSDALHWRAVDRATDPVVDRLASTNVIASKPSLPER